jgi:hypothetical protein
MLVLWRHLLPPQREVLGDSTCRLSFPAEHNKAELNTMLLLSTANMRILQLSNLFIAS